MNLEFLSLPVNVKAILFTGTNHEEVVQIVKLNNGNARWIYLDRNNRPAEPDIITEQKGIWFRANGNGKEEWTVTKDVYIILNGVNNEMYPCDKEQFEAYHTAEPGEITDGYHTFNQLYDHRIALYMALCKQLSNDFNVWKSRAHSDGEVWQGWFLLGINAAEGEQITYHLPIKQWENCTFAETLDAAPKFDGHSSEDVLARIVKFFT